MDLLSFYGVVETIIYHNDENGYCVFLLVDDFGEEIVCVTYIASLKPSEYLNVTGTFKSHKNYGEQLVVKTLEKVLPSQVQGIENYLASGIIKGIGKATAKKIVKKFKEDTFTVIEQQCERLTEIKGISMAKAFEINKQFLEQNEMLAVMMFLQKFGISQAFANRIFKKYKTRTIDVVKNNPYILVEDISGIGFKLADEIAFNIGIKGDSPYRIKAGIKYIINQSVSNGNVFINYGLLVEQTCDLLGVSDTLIEEEMLQLTISGEIVKKKVREKDVVYLSGYFYAENYIAKRLINLSQSVNDKSKMSYLIDEIEKENATNLATLQKKAVLETLKKGVLVITGGPGTGKTTTINTIIKTFELLDNEILLASPTGRASKRLTETTNRQAQTIHRLLGATFSDDTNRVASFDKNEENPLECDVLIIDECSMIDTLLMYNLLKAVADGTRVILVGDVDQLPSVSAGNVLRDIINSNVIPVIKLTEIFRQAKASDIVVNAHKINTGEMPVFKNANTDFFFVERHNITDVVTTISDLVSTRLPKFLSCDGVRDIQVLTPTRKTSIGVSNLNEVLQNRFNPKSKTKRERHFKNGVIREGDKVMQIKNNYNLPYEIKVNNKFVEDGVGVFNGDEGYVHKIDLEKEELIVIFDDKRYVKYDFSIVEELDLSYAITVHKSQGSEYKAIVLPIHSGPPMLLTRNLLYTGVTRGRELVVIVGTKTAISNMINNNKVFSRNSSIDVYLQEIYSIFAKK